MVIRASAHAELHREEKGHVHSHCPLARVGRCSAVGGWRLSSNNRAAVRCSLCRVSCFQDPLAFRPVGLKPVTVARKSVTGSCDDIRSFANGLRLSISTHLQ